MFAYDKYFKYKHLRKTKNPKIENLAQEKKRLKADSLLVNTGGWRGRIKHNENDWKFQSYEGTNLGYDMLCESVSYDQEEIKGDLPNSN